VIKVIAGFRVIKERDIEPVLFKLRSHAMTYQGYIGSENLAGVADASIIATVMTWESVSSWKEWEKSSIRQALMCELRPSLEEEPRITIYKLMPASGWHYARKSS
jgi:heme-degrading monooxygenase HmoA